MKLSDDVVLFGAPLWTDMDRGNPLSALAIRNGMTDFRLIKMLNGNFTPELAAEEFHKTIAYLGKLAEENRSKTIVAMTHHAPSRQGLGGRHAPNALDGAYYSDLEPFIESHPNIRHWVFGHTHVRKSFEIAQCKVMSNARGYYRHEYMAHTFNPDVSFEVEHRPAPEGLEPHAQSCRQVGAKTNDESSGQTDT